MVQKIDPELKRIVPYLYVRNGNGSMYAIWLEYSAHCPPTPQDTDQEKEIPKEQTLENYESLPYKQIFNGLETRMAVAERSRQGEVVYVDLAKHFGQMAVGCMWGVAPKGAFA